MIEEVAGVIERLNAMHMGQVESGTLRSSGPGSSRNVKHVEAQLEGPSVHQVVHLGPPGPHIDPHHLVLCPNVDPGGAELLGCARHQVLDRVDGSGGHVRNAARRVTRPPALLDHHDLQFGHKAARLRRRRHAGCVPADDQKPSSHL
jgi:hypothetical protein